MEGKIIHLSEEIRNRLLEVICNLKDKYEPKCSNSTFVYADFIQALETNRLTIDLLKKIQQCGVSLPIMNILRTARINLDLSKFEGE
jgi:hypothetical protein